MLLFKHFVFASMLALAFAPSADAEIVPSPSDSRFGWTRGDANSHYVGWMSFQDDAGDGSVFDSNPIIVDLSPDAFTPGSTGEVRETGTAGAFISGSGGIYSFSSPLQLKNQFSGAGLAAGSTRVVVQLQTWGTTFDPNSILLSAGSIIVPVAPNYVEETGRISLGPPPQGSGETFQIDTLFSWDVAGGDATYNIQLSATGPHMTFKEFHADVFSTVLSIPEPSSLLSLAVASVGAVAVRRRRCK